MKSARPGHRRRRRVLASVLAALVVLTGAVFLGPYRRQIISYATHWKGSPSHTVAYHPFPADEAPSLRLAVVGDVGEATARLRHTADAVSRLTEPRPFDALLLLGDNVYPAGDPAKLPGTVFEPFAGVLSQGAQLLAILGNHDVKEGHAGAQLAALGQSGRWWSWEKDGLLLIGLDSNDPDNRQQRDWLIETLGASRAPWKVVALHHPPYSAGYQGSSQAARNALSPTFERFGVQLVLSGHEHDYQRSKVIGGVTYVVSGAAAATRRTSERHFTAVSFSWHHFVELSFFPDRIVGRAVNQDARVADEFVLTNPASPVERSST